MKRKDDIMIDKYNFSEDCRKFEAKHGKETVYVGYPQFKRIDNECVCSINNYKYKLLKQKRRE